MLLAILSILYAGFVSAAIYAGVLLLLHKFHHRKDWWRNLYWPIPIVTAIAFGITLVFAVWQLVDPGLYYALRRDGNMLAGGEWWRLFTPLLVQDGDWLGVFFNLLNLALVGTVAEKLFRKRSWLALYFGTGLIGEILAYALTHEAGAGNSLAYFGLATGIMVVGLRSKDVRVLYVSMAGIVIGVLFILLNDIHGLAFVIGGIIASIITLWPKHFHKHS